MADSADFARDRLAAKRRKPAPRPMPRPRAAAAPRPPARPTTTPSRPTGLAGFAARRKTASPAKKRESLIAKVVHGVDKALGVSQTVSDAKWSVTHPRDRLMGRGRASGPQVMMWTGGGGKALIPSSRLLGMMSPKMAERFGAPKPPPRQLVDSMNRMATTRDPLMVSRKEGVSLADALHRQALPMPKNGKFRRGRLYKLDNVPDEVGHGVNRQTFITDPATGTSFIGGRNAHHPAIEQAAIDAGYKFRGPHFKPSQYTGNKPVPRWYQHHAMDEGEELFSDAQAPSRLSWGIWDEGGEYASGTGGAFGGFLADAPKHDFTRAAQIAQLRILRNLRKQGFRMTPRM